MQDTKDSDHISKTFGVVNTDKHYRVESISSVCFGRFSKAAGGVGGGYVLNQAWH